MKIAVIGGGGVRSMFLAKSLVQNAKRIGLTDVVFMDKDAQKLNIFGKLSREVAKRIDPEVRFSITTDAAEAVTAADYIITTIREGEDDMRVCDERIALSKEVLGQETTGAAGFSFAMRSVPALKRYCELAQKLASPKVKVFNFTNPAGVVSQTLRDYGFDFTFGICDSPTSMLRSFAALYHADPSAITGECFGLNHLSFFNSICLNGREILPELLDSDAVYASTDMRYFEKPLAKHLGCALNEYLYYFYYREKAVENVLHAEQTRGEVIRALNRHLLSELSCLDPEKDFEACLKIFDKWYGRREDCYMARETGVATGRPPYHFDLYAKDGGGYAGVALQYIEAERTGKKSQMIFCVPNQGAIQGLRDTDVVEITCDISDKGYQPHRFEHPGELPMQLITTMKQYERLASEAIRTHSRQKAIDCLMVHPLVNSYSLAVQLADAYIRLNAEHSEGWH